MLTQELLPFVIASLLGLAALVWAFALTLALREQRRQQAEQASANAAIQKDLRALCNAAVAVGQRINRAERRLQLLTERQEELGMRQERMDRGDPEAQSYNQAIKLATKGAGVDEIIDVCGLSRGEAELIAMMHRLEQAK